MMRPLVFDFPDDPACTHLDRQYMLGDSLLVAPVFSADGDTSYYVPAGRWTHLRHRGERRRAALGARDGTASTACRCSSGPAPSCRSARATTGPTTTTPHGVTLRVYELPDGQSTTVAIPTVAGTDACSFTVRRVEDRVTVDRVGLSVPWSVLLVGQSSVAAVSAGTVELTDQGCRIDLSADEIACAVTLP